MMFWIVLILVVLCAWIAFKPAWLPAVPQNRLTETVSSGTDRVLDTSKSWWSRLKFWKRHSLSAQQFKAWAETALSANRALVFSSKDKSNFNVWLKNLTEKECDTYLQSLKPLCKTLQFDTSWLIDPEVKGETRRAVEDVVLAHMWIQWRARDIAGWAAYSAWLAAPNRPQNRQFMQTLYTLLIENELASVSPKLLLAPEKERRAYIIQEIRKAAEEHDEFFVLLKKAAGVEENKEGSEEGQAKKGQPSKAQLAQDALS